MHDHDLLPFSAARAALAPLGADDTLAELERLGFSPVTAVRATVNVGDTFSDVLAMIGDDDPDTRAAIEALQQEITAKEPTVDALLAGPGGRCLALLAPQEGALSLELVTTFRNGAQAVTVRVTDANRALLDEHGPSSWPEGGSWWRYVDGPTVEELVSAHQAFVDEVAHTEAPPDEHATVDDVVLYLRNASRLSSSHGTWVGLQEDDDDEDEDPLDVEADDPLGFVIAMMEVWSRHQQLQEAADLARCEARVPVEQLRARPVEPVPDDAPPGRVAVWRHFADERFLEATEAQARIEAGELPIPAGVLKPLVGEVLGDIAARGGHPTPTDDLVDTFVELFGRVARHIDLLDPMPDERLDLPEQLVEAIRAAFARLTGAS